MSKPIQHRAKDMANNIVQAYLEHDLKGYMKAAFYFASVLSLLFPKLSKDKIRRASQAYTEALRCHDEIEEGGHNNSSQLNHNGWHTVRNNLVEMCNALDLPEDYATETTEFFRHHGVRDSRFVMHMLNSDKIFTSSIIGNDNLSLILGGLYLACVRCHDIHDEYGVKFGKKLMETYYSVLLENMK